VLECIDVLREGCRADDDRRDDVLIGAAALVESVHAWRDADDSAEAVAEAKGAEAAPKAAASLRSLRVDVDRLDSLLNLAGEVAVAQARLGAALEASSAAQSALQDFQSLFLNLQESVMRLRVVPLGPVFERFRRAVHDLSEQVDKKVVLAVEGGDVEVDVTLAEALREPLMHMIRNAIDHGIENEMARFAAGKTWPGRVCLSARYDGNYVLLRVSDDGAGLNEARLLEKAQALGLAVKADDPSSLHDVLFAPGVSTAKEVTEISGRGIGMDVVRRSIEGLRGTIALENSPGVGLTVSIRIPLSLALIQGFGVLVGEERYIVPVDSIRECVDLDVERSISSNVGGVVELRGRPLPYVDLAQCLGAKRRSGSRRSIVVVEHGGRRAGLEVDQLLGEVQTVIKPLGGLFAHTTNIAGSAVMHDGRVALVLDVGSLMRSVAA
jgi:two-component system chemotaxis sensor kinase CheA